MEPYRTPPKANRFFRDVDEMLDLDDLVGVVVLKEGYAHVYTRSCGRLEIRFSLKTAHAIMAAWDVYVHGL